MPKLGMGPMRRKQLIAAAANTVATYGLQATTLRLISLNAGVSTGTVAHYFGNKQGLLAATMRDLMSCLGEGVRRRRNLASSPYEHLLAIIEGNFDFVQISSTATATWLAFWAEAMHDPQLARLQNINRLRLRSNLKAHLRNFLPRNKVNSYADTLAALIDGLWLRGAFEPQGIQPAYCCVIVSQQLQLMLPPKPVLPPRPDA